MCVKWKKINIMSLGLLKPIKNFQTLFWILWEVSSHIKVTVQKLFVHKYLPIFVAYYLFVQLGEWEQLGVNKPAESYKSECM